MANSLRILITTGDPDGIGWEVTSKALTALGPRAGVQFFFFRRAGARQTAPALDRRFHRIAVSSLDEAARVPFAPRTLIEIRRPTPAALWVEEAAKACLSGHFHALVTAPLSKTSIRDAGLKDIGHTEILARLSGTRELFMGFLGRKFSVVLATGHQPLREALAGARLCRRPAAGVRWRSSASILTPESRVCSGTRRRCSASCSAPMCAAHSFRTPPFCLRIGDCIQFMFVRIMTRA
jgi:4-hydroxy-L-threonine phosphate dehydrogenase PdxA